MRKRLPLLIFTLVVCLIGFGVLEFSVRSMGRVDSDGQFYLLFNGQTYLNQGRLRPYRLPVQRTDETFIQPYLANPDAASLAYDPLRGWVNNPGYESDVFRINAQGIRAERAYSPTAAADTVRIALFGDSFAFADEVTLTDSWPYLLEQNLRAAGINAEVLNFGVRGYGMDQAYWQWLHEGRAYQPDIVLFAFQPENMHRNVGIFRSLYALPFPFNKPRYVLNDDNTLTLVNSPTIPPNEMIDALASLPDSPLAAHEYWYNDDYVMQWWMGSRLLTLLADLVTYRLQAWEGPQVFEPLTPDDERVQLTQAIVGQFAQGVRADGADFVLLHVLASPYLLSQYRADASYPYQPLLDGFADDFPLLYTDPALRPAGDYWMPNGHYTPQANQQVAAHIADALLQRGIVNGRP